MVVASLEEPGVWTKTVYFAGFLTMVALTHTGWISLPAVYVLFATLATIWTIELDDPNGTKAKMDACAPQKTESACACALSGSCECIRAAFDTDPIWRSYKAAICQGRARATPQRLLNAYSSNNCMYGSCGTKCMATLSQLETEIRDYQCRPDDDIDLDDPRIASQNGTNANLLGIDWRWGLFWLILALLTSVIETFR